MSKAAHGIGLVPLDADGKWIGGRYYLHHLVRAVHSLPAGKRLPMLDVSWQQRSDDDTFAEVRPMLAGGPIIALPNRPVARLKRKLRRLLHGWNDARDVFLDAGIGALFPISPCENPGVPTVFWLADFQYLHLPELFSTEMQEWYRNHFDRNVREAELVVLSSENAREDFARFYPDALHKARVLRFCSIPDEEWHALDPAAVAAAKGIVRPYAIVCNQFSHHKNHDVLLSAIRICAEEGSDISLVCTGSTYGFRGSDYFERLQAFTAEHGIDLRVYILGLLPRAEQMALMRGAVAVLQPSRFEGWSTIIEDAKSLGKAVLASDIAVHREQLQGERGLLLPLDDAVAWAEAMTRVVCGNSTLGADLSRDEATRRADQVAVSTGRSFLAIMREAMAK